jgi:hypothetical protein
MRKTTTTTTTKTQALNENIVLTSQAKTGGKTNESLLKGQLGTISGQFLQSVDRVGSAGLGRIVGSALWFVVIVPSSGTAAAATGTTILLKDQFRPV